MSIRKIISSIVLLFLATAAIYSQGEDKLSHFGIQGGIITGILDGRIGAGFSFHYAFRAQQTLQPEIAISFDSQKGKTFLSGYNSSRSAVSLTPGIRINIRPQENWNPSILVMGGIMLGKNKSNRHDDPGSSGISGVANIGVSNTINKKHMITVGGLVGEYLDAFYIKYGYWF